MLAELGVRGRNNRSSDRGSRETYKRSMDRSGSPPKKRYSPSTSPVGTPRKTNSRSPPRDPIVPREYTQTQIMSPPRDLIVPRAYTPRGRSPRGEGERKKIDSPMKGIERPISPMREMSGVEPMGTTPEYHPTPKKDQDEDYLEFKKKVEAEKATGAIQRYVIPKISRSESGSSRNTSRNNSVERGESESDRSREKTSGRDREGRDRHRRDRKRSRSPVKREQSKNNKYSPKKKMDEER